MTMTLICLIATNMERETVTNCNLFAKMWERKIQEDWQEIDQFYREVYEILFNTPCPCVPSQFSRIHNAHLLTLFFKEPLP